MFLLYINVNIMIIPNATRQRHQQQGNMQFLKIEYLVALKTNNGKRADDCDVVLSARHCYPLFRPVKHISTHHAPRRVSTAASRSPFRPTVRRRLLLLLLQSTPSHQPSPSSVQLRTRSASSRTPPACSIHLRCRCRRLRPTDPCQ